MLPRALTLASCAVLAAACGKPALQAVGGELAVEPAALDFGRTWPGFPVVREVTVRNTSKASRVAALRTEGPFKAPARLRLDGVTQAQVSVTFVPSALGAVTGTLEVSSEGQLLEVALAGEVGAEPVCPEASTCQTARADPATGECFEQPVPDGTACASACLSGATCVAGACIGTAVSCDDLNPCTRDVCDALTGCSNPVATDACPAPSDPCKVATCDPLSGCGIADVADGAPCGSVDCVTAHVCVQGACIARPTPNGASCGAPSLCRAAGVCQNQACVQSPVSPLTPVWTHVAPGHSIFFPGIADRAGNLYWFESSAPADLVSADRNGAVRYRVPIFDQPMTNSSLSPVELVADETLVMLWSLQGRVEGRRTSDGALLWKHDVTDLQAPLKVGPSRMGFWGISLAEGAGGDVLVNLRTNYGGAAWATWIVAFDHLTGALKWSRQYDYINELIADVQGNSYAYVDLWEHRLVSIGPTGYERWNLLVGNSTMPGAAPPVMAVGQSLLTGSSTALRDTATGSVVSMPQSPLYTASHWGPPPLMSATQLVVPDSNSICSTWMGSFALGGFALRWDWSQPQECIFDAALTDRGTVVFATRPRSFSGLMTLRELDAQGAPAFECPVEVQAANGFSVLNDGRWVVYDYMRNRIAAFDVPGARLPQVGWVSAFGGPARNQRQR